MVNRDIDLVHKSGRPGSRIHCAVLVNYITCFSQVFHKVIKKPSVMAESDIFMYQLLVLHDVFDLASFTIAYIVLFRELIIHIYNRRQIIKNILILRSDKIAITVWVVSCYCIMRAYVHPQIIHYLLDLSILYGACCGLSGIAYDARTYQSCILCRISYQSTGDHEVLFLDIRETYHRLTARIYGEGVLNHSIQAQDQQLHLVICEYSKGQHNTCRIL